MLATIKDKIDMNNAKALWIGDVATKPSGIICNKKLTPINIEVAEIENNINLCIITPLLFKIKKHTRKNVLKTWLTREIFEFNVRQSKVCLCFDDLKYYITNFFKCDTY